MTDSGWLGATIVGVALLIAGLVSPAHAAENNTGSIVLTYTPVSVHWDRSRDYNEVHHGLGMAVGIGEDYSVGVSRFRNSYGDMSTLLYLSKEIGCLSVICFGAGGGYVRGYGDHLAVPIAAWGSVRWGMVQLNLIPGVTTLSFVLPLR